MKVRIPACAGMSGLDGRVRSGIAGLFIDPDAVGIACRHIARWRLTGDAPVAKLVHWRESADCSGETGWRVLVGE